MYVLPGSTVIRTYALWFYGNFLLFKYSKFPRRLNFGYDKFDSVRSRTGFSLMRQKTHALAIATLGGSI